MVLAVVPSIADVTEPSGANEGRPGGVFLDEEPKGGKRSDEAIWRRLNHRLDLAGYGIVPIRQGEPRCPRNRRPHRSSENSLRRSPLRLFGGTKSGPTNSGLSSRPCTGRSWVPEHRQPKSTVSEHPRCRSGDPFTRTKWFASNVGGAVRCSGGMSRPAMD